MKQETHAGTNKDQLKKEKLTQQIICNDYMEECNFNRKKIL